MTDSMVYGDNDERLEDDANLFLCKLYRVVRGIMDEDRYALGIFQSLGLKGINDEEQATKQITQHLWLQNRIEKIEGKKGFIKLTHEGLTWCISDCGKPIYSRTEKYHNLRYP